MTSYASPDGAAHSDSVPGGGAGASMEDVLRHLLRRHPGALAAAVTGNSAPELAPLPTSIASGPRQAVLGNVRELVAPADRAVIAKLWAEARGRGVGVAAITLHGDVDTVGTLYMLDLRRQHDCMVVVFHEGAADERDLVLASSSRLPALAPRFARARKDATAIFSAVDPALTEILGWSEAEMVGHRATEFVHPDDVDRAVANWVAMLNSPGPGPRIRLRHRHREGSWVWMEVTNHNLLADAETACVLAEMVDISEEMATHEALRAREQLLGQVTEAVPVGLFHADLDGRLLFANRRLSEIAGAPIGEHLEDLVSVVEAKDRRRLEAALQAATQGHEADLEVAVLPAEGHMRFCTIGIRPLLSDDGEVSGITGCVEDTTTMVRTRRELEARAARDGLTRCLNRGTTLAQLQAILDRQPGDHLSGTAVIFVDLDRFKPVNDCHGHAVGDEVLVRMAERIRSSVRAGDLVGRFGGDEFVVVCPGVTGPDQAIEIARSLAARVLGPVRVSQMSVDVQASFGVAFTAAGGMDAARMIDEADSAMYRSKRVGRAEPVMAVIG